MSNNVSFDLRLAVDSNFRCMTAIDTQVGETTVINATILEKNRIKTDIPLSATIKMVAIIENSKHEKFKITFDNLTASNGVVTITDTDAKLSAIAGVGWGEIYIQNGTSLAITNKFRIKVAGTNTDDVGNALEDVEATYASVLEMVEKYDAGELEGMTAEEKTTMSGLKTVVGDSSSGLVKDVVDNTNGISLLKEDLSELECKNGYLYPQYTYISGKFVGSAGNIAESNGFAYSSPIPISKGDSIIWKACGYNNVVSMISTCDKNGENRNVKVTSIDGTVREYLYKAKEDGYIVLSFYINEPHNLEIRNDFSNTDLRTDVDNIKTSIGYNDGYIYPTWIKNKYIDVGGGIQSSNGFAYSSPIKLEFGNEIVFYGHGYLKNICMISTCDKNGENRTTKVISKASEMGTYSYKAKEDTYIILSCYFNDELTVEKINKISNISLYNEIEKLNPSNPIFYNPSNTGYISIFQNIGVIGDSLASGVFDGGTSTEIEEKNLSWIQIMARNIGINGFNFSQGGMTTKTWLSNFSNAELFTSNKCEAYYIALGVNDHWHTDIELGSTSDIDISDRNKCSDSYYGNYANIIMRIKEIQPKAKIFCITCPHVDLENDKYNEAVRYMETIFDNVFTIDLYTYGWNEFYKDNTYKTTPYWRRSHGTALMYRTSANHITSYTNWIIDNNLEKFRNVQFIGLDVDYY